MFWAALMIGMCCSAAPGSSYDDYTDSIRCGSTFVMEGATKYEVLSKCGEPNLKEVVGTTGGGVVHGKAPHRRRSYNDSSSAAMVIEEWTYDMGSTDFVYTLIFEGSRLTAVKRGSRGGGR